MEQALLGNVYETLVSRSDTNKLQPGIASSWQISDDGLTYTFALRDGMTFSKRAQTRLVRRGLVAAERRQQPLRGSRPAW